MTSSVLNDWNINPDPETLAYHNRQWNKIYGSTVAFAEFAYKWLSDSSYVMDLGCGAGSSTCYLAETFPDTHFTGVDISERLVKIAFEKSGATKNVSFQVANICNLRAANDVDGVVSLQTFSWMPNIEAPLFQIVTKIKPKWMAFSSLFYEGDISCKIEVSEPKRPRTSFHNIYSIPRTAHFLYEHGYSLKAYQPFSIDVDLPKPDNMDLMKTYTVPMEYGPRLQISGPLMLPWYFLAFEKSA